MTYSVYTPVLHLLNYLIFSGVSLFVPPSDFASVAPLQLQQLSASFYFFIPYMISPTFLLIYKLPYVASDILVGFLLYRIILDKYNNASLAREAFVFWYLNPLAIIVSSVMGQNDSLFTLFILASVYFVMRNELFFAGLSASLSVLFKIYDVFFVFLLLLVVSLVSEGRNGSLVKEKLFRVSKFVGGLVCSPLLLLPTLRFFGYFLFVRLFAPSLGGLNIWGSMEFIPAAASLTGWATANFFSISLYGYLISALLAVTATFLLVSYLQTDSFILMATGGVILLLLPFLGSPLVNPNNLLPILAFVIMLIPLLRKSCVIRFWTLSVAASAYVLYLLGPGIFFFPATEVIPGLTIARLAQATVTYMSLPGLLTNSLNDDIITILSAVGFVTMLSMLRFPFTIRKELLSS